MKKIQLLCLLFFSGAYLSAQQDSTEQLTFSGYVETYYAYDFNYPQLGERPGFLYSHARHNEFNVNLAFLKANYTASKVRANLALMTGNYAQFNLAQEPVVLRSILEANAGIRLGQYWWLDAGVMPSHIGIESAISKDCWTLTRSMAAENSPYFESGAKLTWSRNGPWTVALMALNGWQRISRPPGNSTPAWGTQITWKKNDKLTLNWSTFYGNDKPDFTRQYRFFNNFYGIYQPSSRWGFTLGYDIGWEQQRKYSSDYYNWSTVVLIARNTLNDRWAWAARFERYDDADGVIVSTPMKTNGYSLNLDYSPMKKAVLRVEGRFLQSNNEVFVKNDAFTKTNFAITTALSVAF